MKNKLSKFPIQIDDHFWYYEERWGIAIYVKGIGRVGFIPWEELQRSIERFHANKKQEN